MWAPLEIITFGPGDLRVAMLNLEHSEEFVVEACFCWWTMRVLQDARQILAR